jgi:hypothetical protein
VLCRVTIGRGHSTAAGLPRPGRGFRPRGPALAAPAGAGGTLRLQGDRPHYFRGMIAGPGADHVRADRELQQKAASVAAVRDVVHTGLQLVPRIPSHGDLAPACVAAGDCPALRPRPGTPHWDRIGGTEVKSRISAVVLGRGRALQCHFTAKLTLEQPSLLLLLWERHRSKVRELARHEQELRALRRRPRLETYAPRYYGRQATDDQNSPPRAT